MASLDVLTNPKHTPLFPNIVAHCDLKTFLNLRLVCRHFEEIIITNETTPSLLTSVAANTFPDVSPVKIPLQHPDVPIPSLKWFLQLPRGYIVYTTTTKAVDRAGSWLGFHVAPSDPLGDTLRQRVANGLFILWHLSDIAHSITAAAGAHQAENVRRHRIEKQILRTRLEYVTKHLHRADVFDFELMYHYVPAWFYNRRVADLDEGRRRWVGRKDSWINWLILREGPPLLRDLWVGADTARIEEEWLVRGEETREVERRMAIEFHMELGKRFPKIGVEVARWIAECQDGYLQLKRRA